MAKAALTLDQVRNFCVFDGKLIPAERVKRNAVTCSKECAKAIERQRMLLMEQSECKYCRRPSTPEERESYKQWRRWVKEQATAKSTEEITEENTDEATEVVTGDSMMDGGYGKTRDWSSVYPYIYTRFNSARKGQRCRKLIGDANRSGMHVQIQFEDGETLIADKTNLKSGRAKKYSEKRGRPRRVESTLAAKPEIQHDMNEGE
jgi:hypothetical protein